MYKKIEDCCKYQEQIKKLTSRTKKRKKKQINVDDDCEDRGNESARGGAKKKLMPVRNRYAPEIAKGIDRIKPSVKVRDEYSHSRHTRCVMESFKDTRMPHSGVDSSGTTIQNYSELLAEVCITYISVKEF